MRVTDYEPGDEAFVRDLFRATIALGRPLPFEAPALELAYGSLCLDWFLDRSRPARVGILRGSGGMPCGYALVCLDPDGLAQWQRAAALRFAAALVPLFATARLRVPASRFVALRALDAVALARRPPEEVRGLPCVHLNSQTSEAAGFPGRVLADWVDDVVRSVGFDRWWGEINARRGRRAGAITRRWGAEILACVPNRTLSVLCGEPVDRLTVGRVVPVEERSAPRLSA